MDNLTKARIAAAEQAERNIEDDEYVPRYNSNDDEGYYWTNGKNQIRKRLWLEPKDHDLKDQGLDEPAVFIVIFLDNSADILTTAIVRPREFGKNMVLAPNKNHVSSTPKF